MTRTAASPARSRPGVPEPARHGPPGAAGTMAGRVEAFFEELQKAALVHLKGRNAELDAAIEAALGGPAEMARLIERLQRANADVLAHYAANDSPMVHDARSELAARGELLPPAAFVERMDWTRQALSKALAARRVFFVESQGERLYPAFYADPHLERRHLEAVTRRLGDLPGGSKWMFFTTPKGSLSRLTPLQALRRGHLAQVLDAAAGFAER